MVTVAQQEKRPEKLAGRRYAISYIRFSTKKQERGNSFERQLEATNVYCDKYNLILSSDNYHDLGKSAYKEINLLPESGLGFFLHKLKSGEIKKPEQTCLIIESLDRLSRAKLDESIPVFMKILKTGIAIITLSDNQIYIGNTDNNSQTQQLMISLMMLSKAHSESLDKSYRIGQAWQKKKAKARKSAQNEPTKAITRMCPFWLTVDDNNEYQEKPECVETIKRIFNLTTGEYTRDDEPQVFDKKVEEKSKKKSQKTDTIEVDHLSLSSIEIAKLLNAESVPIIKSGNRKKTDYWNTSNINKILSNQSLTGVYQPKKLVEVDRERPHPLEEGEIVKYKTQVYKDDGKPISNFYPVIIKESQFSKANLYKRARLKGKRGRKGTKFSNLLTNIATCRSCGSNMIHNFKGVSKKGKRWVYLQCSLAKSGGNCKYSSVNYDIVEYNLLRFMSSSEFSPVIGDKKTDQKTIDNLNKKITEIKLRLDEIEDTYKAYMKMSVKGFEDINKKELEALAEERTILLKQKIELSDELEILVSEQLSENFDRKHFQRLMENINLNNNKLTEEQLYFNRMRTNGIIENLTKAIKVDTERKKLLIIYKDGSGQVIGLSDIFEKELNIPLCVDLPRFVFPESIQGVSQQKYNDAIYNVCMLMLDRCEEAKNKQKFSAKIKKQIEVNLMKAVLEYLTKIAESDGHDFKYDKKNNQFLFTL